MAYAADIPIMLSASQTGLTLEATLVDGSGVVAGPISSGFVERGDGLYLWSYSAFPDDFAGMVEFSDGSSVVAAASMLETWLLMRLPAASDIAAEVDTALSTSHGAGSWEDAGGGLTAAEVWSHSTRTLTQSAASVAAAMSGSDLSIRRGDTVTITLTGLGSLAARSKLYFTVKTSTTLDDSAATVQVEETAGAVILNGVAATAEQATLVVDDEVAGNITITLLPALTAQLVRRSGLSYDVQVVRGDGSVATLTEASAAVSDDVTRATS